MMKNLRPYLVCITCVFVFLADGLRAQQITVTDQGKPASIRGMSVINDSIAWVSGSKGYVALSTNGGKTWTWQQVKGFERADFRSIVAFSDKEAVIMASGTPALVLKTTDGGTTWQQKYRNADTAYFLDAMDFDTPQHGFILGDPIHNKFLLLETNDGGSSWNTCNDSPIALPGEAAFAASSTCLRVNGRFAIVTGGNVAEADFPKKNGGWAHHLLPLASGQAAMGAFSVAAGKKQLVAAGGDYQHDKNPDSTACYSTDNGLTWHLAQKPPAGYQSCVEYLGGSSYLATGTPGSNLTTDGGKTWVKVDGASYNVCRKARHGKLVLLAGNKGKIAILNP
jgi:photosystem II stability/assembly factor-like uncharacterized protein